MKIDKPNILNRIKSIREEALKEGLKSEIKGLDGHFHQMHKEIPIDAKEIITNSLQTDSSKDFYLQSSTALEKLNINTDEAESIIQRLRIQTKSVNKDKFTL